MQLLMDVVLDIDQLTKLAGYYLYRSEEMAGDRPIIDGVYIQRDQLGESPPVRMRLLLEWDQ